MAVFVTYSKSYLRRLIRWEVVWAVPAGVVVRRWGRGEIQAGIQETWCSFVWHQSQMREAPVRESVSSQVTLAESELPKEKRSVAFQLPFRRVGLHIATGVVGAWSPILGLSQTLRSDLPAPRMDDPCRYHYIDFASQLRDMSPFVVRYPMVVLSYPG